MLRYSQQQKKEWFLSTLGRAICQKVTLELQPILSLVPGQVAVQLASSAVPNFLDNKAMPYVFYCVDSVLECVDQYSLVCEFTDLPLESDSVSLLVMSFALEDSKDPRRLLCEAYRVLKPGGQLVMVGFNGWSIWNAFHRVAMHQGYPWSANFYKLWRIKKWLRSIGYGIIQNKTVGFTLSSKFAFTKDYYRWIEVMGQLFTPKMGACYLVCAQKKTSGVTPLEALWERRKNYINSGSVVGSMRDSV